MRCRSIDNAIEVIRNHINTTEGKNPEIESYLVSYALTTIYAEYESRLNILIARRCALTDDVHLKNFSQTLAKCGTEVYRVEKRRTGRITLSDLAKILKQFGEDYRDGFTLQIENKPAHTAWDKIVNNRQLVAHQQGTNLTFQELEEAYHESLKVLDAFGEALNLPREHLKDLI